MKVRAAMIPRRHRARLMGCFFLLVTAAIAVRRHQQREAEEIVNDQYDLGKPTSHIIDIDGPVHYVDFGGPPGADVVVLVHGVGGSHVTWLPVGELLARHWQVYAVDLPGHGLTPLAKRRGSVESNRVLLERFLSTVSPGPALLIGHSMGALICLSQAWRAPSTTVGVVLIDSALPMANAAVPEWIFSTRFRRYAGAVVRHRLLAPDTDIAGHAQVVRHQLAMSCEQPGRVPTAVVDKYIEVAVRRRRQSGVTRAFLRATMSTYRLVSNSPRVTRLLSQVAVPVMMIHGAADLLVDLAAARGLAATKPAWRFEVADDSGHVPMLESPQWTAEIILDWVRAIRSVDGEVPIS